MQINNAGILPSERILTQDGFESAFAVNTLGPFILTMQLLPLLKETSRKYKESRVVSFTRTNDTNVKINVSSGGMYTAKLDCSNLQSEKAWWYDGNAAYAHTKRQEVVMTTKFAESHPDVTFSSVHPGWAETPGVRSSIPGFFAMFQKYFRTVEQGADGILWLACSKEVQEKYKNVNGEFWLDREIAPKHLSMAGTQEGPNEANNLMAILDQF